MKMIRTIGKFLVILSVFIFATVLYSEEQDKLLSHIAADINNYKNKEVTLKLKLKCLDNIFEKITFYDKKNHDIEFDVSSRKKKADLKDNMLNLHEGMDYHVSFRVIDLGALGEVIGELISFKPVILSIIPE